MATIEVNHVVQLQVGLFLRRLTPAALMVVTLVAYHCKVRDESLKPSRYNARHDTAIRRLYI